MGAFAQTKTVDLTTGDPRKRIVNFVLPLLIGNLFQELYNAEDTVVVGKFAQANALGAVGAAGVPFMLVNALTRGFSVGAAILVGQYFGAKKKDALKEISGTVFLMSLGDGSSG